MARLVTGFGEAAERRRTYIPGPRLQRLSFVWWARGPSIDRDPLLAMHDDGTASTIVALWPSDLHGHVDRDHLEDVQVRRWDLSREGVAALGRHHATWGQGDIAVRAVAGGLDLWPRARSIYALALASDEPEARQIVSRIRSEVDRIAAELLGEEVRHVG